MASAIRSLGLVARASAYRLPSGVRRARRIVPVCAPAQKRAFASSPRRFADDGDDNESLKPDGELDEPSGNIFEVSSEDHAAIVQEIESGEAASTFDGISIPTSDGDDLEQDDVKPTRGFFATGEGQEDPDEDEEFEPDDISSNAHLELEQVRELREFARVMAWDMPLLYDHRKAFKPPTKQQPLRFRYTTYLGEDHPATKKVVLDFSPSALPDLSPVQKAKLIKILGTRYNPQTDTVKMSSEHHPTSAQNKRHLATTLDAILKECREGKDTFEDVPFDFRHHKEKVVHKFPEEWKITDERTQYLQASRAKALEADQARMMEDGQVDGRRMIESMLASGLTQGTVHQREAVRVPAGRGGAQPAASRQRR